MILAKKWNCCYSVLPASAVQSYYSGTIVYTIHTHLPKIGTFWPMTKNGLFWWNLVIFSQNMKSWLQCTSGWRSSKLLLWNNCLHNTHPLTKNRHIPADDQKWHFAKVRTCVNLMILAKKWNCGYSVLPASAVQSYYSGTIVYTIHTHLPKIGTFWPMTKNGLFWWNFVIFSQKMKSWLQCTSGWRSSKLLLWNNCLHNTHPLTKNWHIPADDQKCHFLMKFDDFSQKMKSWLQCTSGWRRSKLLLWDNCLHNTHPLT